MGFHDEVLDLIRQVMPATAEVQVVSSAFDFDVDVFWKLDDTPDRPNKISRKISIHFTHAAVQDYTDASADKQADAYRRIKSLLSRKLASFNPKHDTPRHEAPPVEQWFIDTDPLWVNLS